MKKWLLPSVHSAQNTAVHGRWVAHLQDQRGLRGHQGLQLEVHTFAASDQWHLAQPTHLDPHMQRPVSLPGPCPSRELAEADPPSLMTPCSGSPLSWASSPLPIGLSSLRSSNSTMGFYNRGPTLLWLPWKRQEETSHSGYLNVPANKAITKRGLCLLSPCTDSPMEAHTVGREE